MSKKMKRCGAVAILAALSVCATARANAQWSGGGATANWTNASNWVAFDRPENDGTDFVSIYGDATRNTSVVNQNWWIKGIYIASWLGDSTDYTFDSSNGAILTIDDYIQSDVPELQTFNVPMKANSDFYITNGGTTATYGELIFNGQLDTNGYTIALLPSTGNIGVNASIVGGGAVLVRGAGTVHLGAANSFNGGLKIENGTVQFFGASSLGSIDNSIYLDHAGTSNPPTLLRLASGTGSIPVFLNSGECRLSAPAGVTATYSFGLQGTTAGNLVKVGAGTVNLSASARPGAGQDAAFGETFVNEGTLHLSADDALSGRRVTIRSAASLSTDASTSQSFGQLYGAGNLQLGNSATLFVGAGTASVTNGSGTFTGVISGNNVSVSKRAAGTLSLQGNNAYSGTTVIEGGVLSADNTTASTSATGTSAIAVKSGGTLAGDGAVLGAVTVDAGGTIAPSNSATPGTGIGSLTAGSLTLSSGSDTVIEYSGTLCDRVTVSGHATVAGRLRLVGTTAGDLVQRRVVAAATLSGTFATIEGVVVSPTLSLAVTYDENDVFVTRARPGDANLDATVNFDDLLVLASNYNQPWSATWSKADFNGNGAVNFDDLLILAANYNQSFAGALEGDWALARASVPESTAVATIVAAGASLLRRRRGDAPLLACRQATSP